MKYEYREPETDWTTAVAWWAFALAMMLLAAQ